MSGVPSNNCLHKGQANGKDSDCSAIEVDFASIDDEPVDLVFMLLSPTDAGAAHLKALAQVSRVLRDKSFVAKLRGAATDDALYALFDAGEARDAA